MGGRGQGVQHWGGAPSDQLGVSLRVGDEGGAVVVVEVINSVQWQREMQRGGGELVDDSSLRVGLCEGSGRECGEEGEWAL